MNDVTQDEEDSPSAVEQPKKRSIMDDDDDDLGARAAAIQKAENDRLAKEAFAKAAEEDGTYTRALPLQYLLTSFTPQLKRALKLARRAGSAAGSAEPRKKNPTLEVVPSGLSSARRVRSTMTRI
jgi:hypothetical protein